MFNKKLGVILFILFAIPAVLFAQSLPVGTLALDDFYRRNQLAGTADSSVSFTIRPISSGIGRRDLFYPDTSQRGYNLLNAVSVWKSRDSKYQARLLPLNIELKFNSHHPYGWNDGAMIPARGLQTLLSGGYYAEYGRLSVQLKPEIVLAANSPFKGFSEDHYEVISARYYDYYNYIDQPERFGTNSYAMAYWGQSSIRLNFDPVSFGISTENLWWGPGTRNSLLMSNNAPGFKHLTLNTSRPVKTPVGSVEAQLVAGRLEGSGFTPLQPDRLYFGDPLYIPKPTDWRYMSGLTVTWQPKWVPGLFVGLARSFQVYSKDLGKRIGDYIPIFLPFQKTRADDSINTRDQLSSIFFRWLWAEEKAEVYFEYGRNARAGDLRDFLLEPGDSRAYIFGLKKLLPFRGRPDENILVEVEVTQLQQTSPNTVRDARAWYLSKYIRHGYTNRGEVIGAGIGPGSNLQSLDVSWVKGLKKIGLQLERYTHNNDFYYYAYEDSKDWRRHWTDLAIGANSEWNYKNLILHARLQFISSLNYQWFLRQYDFDNYFTNGRDRFGISMQMGAMYRF